MATHNFKIGDRVAIVNDTVRECIFEGWARVGKLLDGLDFYAVRFEGAGVYEPFYERYVELDAQDDPVAYVVNRNGSD